MSVLGAHVQALLKPSGVQHWLKGTSTPPEVARHTKALLTLENLHVGSSSCKAPGCSGNIGRLQAHVRSLTLPSLPPTHYQISSRWKWCLIGL